MLTTLALLTTSLLQSPACIPKRQPPAHRFVAAQMISVREANDAEGWAAARVLQRCFDGFTLFHYGSLRVPSLNANVFFNPLAAPLIAVATSDEMNDGGDAVQGVAQMMRVQLRPEVGGSGAGRIAAFMQSVAVAPDARRQGVASKMVEWCEAAACERWSDVDEAWLAVDEQNAAAIALYDGLGFERLAGGVRFGNVLMRKHLRSSGEEDNASARSATTKEAPAAAAAGAEAASRRRASDIRAGAVPRNEPAPPPPSALPEAAAAPSSLQDEATFANGGIGFVPLARNLAVQALYVLVAAGGVGILLAPFGGPTPTALLGLSEPWAADCAPWWATSGECPDAVASLAHDGGSSSSRSNLVLASILASLRNVGEAFLGALVAWLELRRLEIPLPSFSAARAGGALSGSNAPSSGGTTASPPTERLQYGPAQAEQMRPLYEISAGESALPLAALAIIIWQLAIGLAEELYYRGFVESAGVLAFSPLSTLGAGGVAFQEAVPLVASAALFGLVHTEFIQDAPPGASRDDGTLQVEGGGGGSGGSGDVEETKAFWFRTTAAYGALYSILYIATGHRLLAPLCAHAGLNIGLCLRDWERMRVTPTSELERIFAAATVEDELPSQG